MTEVIALDSAWIAANPLPVHGVGTDKNSRGRVLAIGGSTLSPGALRLAAEAALRVGAGKVQMATLASIALSLGLIVPEAGVLALPEHDGEIGPLNGVLDDAFASTDTLLIGPGIVSRDAATAVIVSARETMSDDARLVLDAAAIAAAGPLKRELAQFSGRSVLTPHHGEMAALTGRSIDDLAADPAAAARAAAREYGAVVVLKSSDTLIAAPDGTLLSYAGGGVGLATGGSGDVLAGVIAGLLSRGAAPIVAAGWGVWLHGHSGRRMASRHGPIGFLARELLSEIPRLLPQ